MPRSFLAVARRRRNSNCWCARRPWMNSWMANARRGCCHGFWWRKLWQDGLTGWADIIFRLFWDVLGTSFLFMPWNMTGGFSSVFCNFQHGNLHLQPSVSGTLARRSRGSTSCHRLTYWTCWAMATIQRGWCITFRSFSMPSKLRCTEVKWEARTSNTTSYA